MTPQDIQRQYKLIRAQVLKELSQKTHGGLTPVVDETGTHYVSPAIRSLIENGTLPKRLVNRIDKYIVKDDSLEKFVEMETWRRFNEKRTVEVEDYDIDPEIIDKIANTTITQLRRYTGRLKAQEISMVLARIKPKSRLVQFMEKTAHPSWKDVDRAVVCGMDESHYNKEKQKLKKTGLL